MAENSNGLQKIKHDNEVYSGLLDLIPVSFYFDNEFKHSLVNGEAENGEDFEKLGKKGGKTKKRSREEANKFKKKNKKLKLDPTQATTVSKYTEKLAEINSQKDEGIQKGTKVMHNGPSASAVESMPGESREDLRMQLQAKIDALKDKRKALGKHQDVEKKKLQRQESQMKAKMRKKLQKQANKAKHHENGVRLGSPKPKQPIPANPVYNKEGKMVFSKFDFSEKRKEVKSERTKNYKKLLEQVQQKKEKLTELKETDAEKAKTLQQKEQWQTVLAKAEGVRVKDNPDLIKKTIKRVEKRKEKSRKSWEERKEKVEQKMKQRQDKRTANIKRKKDSRINKKIDKQKKKGRIIPGF